jgi:hypothetical protein
MFLVSLSFWTLSDFFHDSICSRREEHRATARCHRKESVENPGVLDFFFSGCLSNSFGLPLV